MSNSSDFSKLFNSTFATVTGMVGDAKADFDAGLVRYLSKLNLVTREEFEVMQQMTQEARLEQENLKKRIAVLEKLNSNHKVKTKKGT